MPALTRVRSRAGAGRNVASAYDPDAQAYFAVAGVSGEPYLSAIDKLVLDLKSAGVWTKFDRLWLFANETAGAALTCLKSLQTATPRNSPSFVAGDGYALDGISQHLDSNLPLNAGGQYQRDNCSYGLDLALVNSTSNKVPMGALSDDFAVRAFCVFAGADVIAEMNNGDIGAIWAAHNGRAGFWHWVRSASNAVAGYKNGTQYDTGSGASLAISGVATTFFIGGQNFAGSPFSCVDGKVRAAWIGAAFSSEEAANFHSAYSFYKATVGAGSNDPYVPPSANLAFDYNPGIAANVTLNGGNVSAISNPTGADPGLAQATANKQPLLVSAGLNGYDTVRFDGMESGAGDFLRASSLTTGQAQPYTVYRVVKVLTYNANDYIDDTYFTPGYAANNGALHMTSEAGSLTLTTTAASSLPNSTYSIGNWVIVTTVFNGSNSENRKNKTSAAIGNSGSNNVGRYAIGGRGDDPGALYGNFEWGRSIGYRAVHDTATQNAIIDGLAAQYGLVV